MPNNLETLILRRAAIVKQSKIAEAIKRDEGTVSKMLAGEVGFRLNCAEAFLDVLGLMVIEKSPDGMVCLPKREYDALVTLAEKYFEECK